MSAESVLVLFVVLVALAADTATGIVLFTRRGGRVWALLCAKELGVWLFTAGWLAIIFADPHRYDRLPWPMWPLLVGRMLQSLATWRLSFRVLAGNK